MGTFDCRAERTDGVTLVTAILSDIPEPTRITVSHQLDGPLWPPRRQGVPEAGWDDDGFEGVVAPGTHTLGYATPAPPTDPPAALVAAKPAPDEPTAADRVDTPNGVLRELGDPSPPADAVPAVDQADAAHEQAHTVRTDEQADAVRSVEQTGTIQADAGPAVEQADESSSADRGSDTPQPIAEHHSTLPDDVSLWLATVARRVDRAEALAGADSLPEATDAVREAGGLAGTQTIASRADSDVETLRALASRAERLADRRAMATVPTETLNRLA